MKIHLNLTNLFYMHNLGSSEILADVLNFYKSYICLQSLGTEKPYNVSASLIQLLYSDSASQSHCYLHTQTKNCTTSAELE